MPASGLLLINKSIGPTSFYIVKRVKSLLKVKKVGHAGTLDPNASGVLPVVVGEATKLIPYLHQYAKHYMAVCRLGMTSTSGDLDGEITLCVDKINIQEAQIAETCLDFVGEIEQVPPKYSAVKVDGRRAYKLARQGKEFSLKEKRVNIHQIKMLCLEGNTFIIYVKCGKGTYIRQLVSDIGDKLGCGAVVTELNRIAYGNFSVGKCIPSELIYLPDPLDIGKRAIMSKEDLEQHFIPLTTALYQYPELEITPDIADKIRRGFNFDYLPVPVDQLSILREEKLDKIKVVTTNDDLVALVEMNGEREPRWAENQFPIKLVRVFHGN